MLEKILGNRIREVWDKMAAVPLEEIKRKAARTPPPLDFKGAVTRREGQGIKIIAEIKRQSPSAGLIAPCYDPKGTALKYARGGAAAISMLTEEKFFGGSQACLREVRSVCSLPLLAKDFFLHPYQVYESRYAGADSVLLITRILGKHQLAELYGLVLELGMAPLVEVHDERDMERALNIGAGIIAVNNRDLEDFSIDMTVTQRLLERFSPPPVTVSASGVKTPEDVSYLEGLGVDAVLVGSTLMANSNPEKELCRLKGGSLNGPDKNVRHQDCCGS